MKKPFVNVTTPYSQTIDAAFKMLRLCGVTYNVVNGIIFVIGRDGLVYNTLAASTEYNSAQPEPTQPEPAQPKPAAPIPTRTRQTALPLPDTAQITHSEEKNTEQNVQTKTKKVRAVNMLARTDIPMEARLKFRRKLKNRTQVTIYEPYLINLKVGEVAQVPITVIPEGISPDRLRSSMSAWAYDIWGKNSNRTCITTTHVELLRIK